MTAASGRTEPEAFTAGVREAAAALRDVFEPTPLQRNDYLSAKHGADVWLKREDLSPVRSYKIRGAFNAMRKALARAPRPAALRLRLGREPRPGHGLCLPALRHRGRRLHAGDDPAAEDRQDPPVRRRPGRDPPGRRLFRRDAARRPGLHRPDRRALPAALRRRRRDRGPGHLRARGLRRAPRARPPRHPGRRRRPRRRAWCGSPTRSPPSTEVRLVEPEGGPSLAAGARGGRPRDAARGRQLRRRRRGGAHRRPQLRGAAAASPPETCSSRRRTASAPPWSRC